MENNKFTLEYTDFSLPTINNQRELFKIYPELENTKLDKIQCRVFKIGGELNTAYLITYDIEQKYIYEMKNLIDISRHYLTYLWYYSSNNPDRIGNGSKAANSISYETYYEIIYSKLSSAFDRYLHLINIYFDLGLKNIEKINELNKEKDKLTKNGENNISSNEEKIDVYKNKIRGRFKNNNIENKFDDLYEDKRYKSINSKRNLFVHNELIFENYIIQNQDGFIDQFNYKENTDETIRNFINFVNFLNEKAIPFLYEFHDYLESKKVDTQPPS